MLSLLRAFQKQPMDKSHFSFAFIADPQIGMNSRWGLKGPSSDHKRFEAAVQYVNEADMDFVILGGDYVCGPDEQKQLDVFMSTLAKLQVPYYGILGNHDENDPRDKPSPLAELGPLNGFSFYHKGSYFLGINATHLRGAFGPELQQNEWDKLQSSLSQIDPECRQRFLIMHYTLFYDHPDVHLEADETNEYYWMRIGADSDSTISLPNQRLWFERLSLRVTSLLSLMRMAQIRSP